MLTNLSQIKGGLKLRSDVDNLLSFQGDLDATRILTTILEDSADDTSNYSVDDVIKAIIDGANIKSDDDNRVTLSTLAAALTAFKNKPVKDTVRVNLTAVKNNDTFTVDTTAVESSLKTNNANTTLPVYTTDGRVVFSDAGHTQLTFNLTTGAFSAGTPQVLVDGDADRAQSETETGVTVYTPYTSNFNFKVFATGEFTLATLPQDALLDNQEMQSLAYDQAIDKIVLKLASDEDVVAAISQLVGDTAVQTQITNITNTLYKFASITGTSAKAASGTEGQPDYVAPVAAETITADTHVYSANKTDELLANMNAAVTTEVNKKYNFSHITTSDAVAAVSQVNSFGVSGYVAPVTAVTAEGAATANTEVYSGKLVDTKIEQAVKAALETASAKAVALDMNIRENADRIDRVQVALTPVYKTFEITAPTRTFTLTTAASDRIPVKMYINNLVYFENEDFTLNAERTVITWTFQEQLDGENNPVAGHVNGVDGFEIDSTVTDQVRVEYFANEFIARTVAASV